MTFHTEKFTVDQIVNGYIEAALFADRPEYCPNARFTKKAIATAKNSVSKIVSECGELAIQAIELYGPDRFGNDIWFTRAGHGVGFWDREELECAPVAPWFALSRDNLKFTIENATLGEALSAICYGDCRHVSKWAYPSLCAYRGWINFLGE